MKIIQKITASVLGAISLGSKVHAVTVDYNQANHHDVDLNSQLFQGGNAFIPVTVAGDDFVAKIKATQETGNLKNCVFQINETGQLQVVCAKSELENLKRAYLQLQLQSQSASRTLPTTDG